MRLSWWSLVGIIVSIALGAELWREGSRGGVILIVIGVALVTREVALLGRRPVCPHCGHRSARLNEFPACQKCGRKTGLA